MAKPKGKPKPKMYAFFVTDSDAFARMGATCETCVEPSEEFVGTSALINKDMKLQRGGLCTFLFVKCSVAPFDETVLANWQAAINAGDAFIIRDCTINGSMATEATTVTRGCNSDTIATNRNITITMVDASDNEDFNRAEFYRYLQNNQNAFRVAAITYDGVLITPSRRANANPNRAVAENTDGFNEVTTTLTWRELAPAVPQTLSWSPDAITLPNCTVSISFVAVSGSNYTLQAVSTFSPGATSATYVWRVNGVVAVGVTDPLEVFAGTTSGDLITVTVTDNGTIPCVVTSAPFVVP